MKLLTLALAATTISAQGAVLFNGTSQRLSSKASGSLPPLRVGANTFITASVWINRPNTNYCPIWSGGRSNAFSQGWNYEIVIGPAFTNAIRFRYSNSADVSDQIYTTAPQAIPETNVWTHLGVSYKIGTAASMSIFVNGVLQNGAWTTGTGNVAADASVDPSFIATDGAGKFGAVAMSEFAWFFQPNANLGLSARQMEILARSRLSGIQRQFDVGSKTLGIYWPLNDAPGFGAVGGTNFFTGRGTRVNLGGSAIYPVHGSPINSPIVMPEVVCSFVPNE